MSKSEENVTFTKEEIFDIYGLIIGMIKMEAKSNQKEKPATDWYYKWAEHPSLLKAKEIYNETSNSF